jgi:putative acetyltransferase
MALTFHQGELDREDVQDLLALHFAAMRNHSPPNACHVLPAAALWDPSITLFSVRGAGALLGVGALKELEPGHGEIKSMRTAPAALGGGVGRMLLNRIVEEAQQRGYRRLSLETGSGPEFAAALRLYDGAGFRPCAPFASYRHTLFTRFLSLDL